MAGPFAEGLLTDAFLASVMGRVAACTEDELLARAREVLIRTQRERPDRQRAGVAATDSLLGEARRRGRPDLLGWVLRYSAVIRLVTQTPLVEADPLIDELTRLAGRYGMTVLQADGHALRARRSVLAGVDEGALSDAATALALVSDPEPPRDQISPQWEHALAATLTDLGLVLISLGAHELADESLTRAERHLRSSAGPVELLVNGLNRLRLQLSWGLRLERVGRSDEGAERFLTARQLGRIVEPLWMRTVFNSGDRPAADQCAVLAAAFALADPGAAHVDRLRGLSRAPIVTSERVMIGIALGRCLERCGRTAAARMALATTRAELAGGPDRSESMLLLALSRELARVQEALTPTGTPTGPATRPIRDYAAALEAEMWSLREARIAAMCSQAEHLRLAREHGTITAQALSDPLTGLPNRRALDQQLRQSLSSATGRPCSVALIDLDGFKDVNDRYSHATGDEVLRAVATALRSALRADDTVARYGGDEFVALLPGTAPGAAQGALERAVQAVAGLTPNAGAGVTLSVGVVAVGARDDAGSVLARADSAMYRAKRLGGNQVCVEQVCVEQDECPDGDHVPAQPDP
jgi:diguanylate cyclase (GGDEF)-like protein